MTPRIRLVVLASAYAMVSVTLVVAQRRDPLPVIKMTPGMAAPLWHCEDEMHEYYIRRFESAEGFGLSRMPQPPTDCPSREPIFGGGNSMGALRGDGSCLKCHTNIKEGELLGAFIYRLRRIAE